MGREIGRWVDGWSVRRALDGRRYAYAACDVGWSVDQGLVRGVERLVGWGVRCGGGWGGGVGDTWGVE